MAELEIIGFDISNWVRAARIACEEKGVKYTLTTNDMKEFSDMKGAAHLALHPFGRIPAMRHGEVVVFETLAIGHYLDRMFQGPPLVPEDPLEAVRLEQWASAMIDYVSRSIMGRCVVQYVLPQFTGKPIDRATIDGAIPDIRNHLAVLDRALGKGPFLHGEKPYLDDFILMPMVDALAAVAPEGPGLIAEAPNVARLRAAFQGRPSYHSTIPQMFRKAA
ncbi:MAG TPA: glutathione S-transferase family protein [Methyloceanibacter sp.]|nr:glutathione S-transferase family protein [Methyloceanibacter sp.]